jgi:UDP-2,3-diacylglucosamine hydrolase
MTAKAIFLSDVHLGSSADANAALLIRLLQSMENGEWTHLFLLGDIFDLWIADHRYFTGKFASVLAQLQNLKKSGVEIHYFEGNHDLDLRPFFERKLGWIVHERAQVLTLDHWTVRIEHGDEMDPSDRDYLFLRWLLRTPFVRALGRHLPGFIVNQIGEFASRRSRRYTSKVRHSLGTEGVRSKLATHAREVFKVSEFDLLIAGHVHVPFDEFVKVEEREIRVVNLGTWLEKPLILELNPNAARLVTVLEFLAEENR